MRYFWASVVAVSLIGLPFLYVWMVVKPKAAVPPGGGIELSSTGIWLVWWADMVIDFWGFVVPLVLIICLGIARLFRPAARTPEK
jgi:hypothetical protein